ncbi:chemotaxis protein histidine kinase CheA [Neorhizobium huautlense]|uniref:Chemotaxis protein histidine kinase CheA n=1 Tax=Neorhizobium huautlense TaxID=67774 RepID=A0ABT9PWG8_9HYPH|nr:hypothetical protein [Neorhizobium huautlense]MDP9838838.1 chemotaxis protein histidine kinase CheA [Neorhizobium huautlense]
MKTSLGTSFALHSAALAFALVSLGSPAPMEVAPVEALPVDIVPVESITQIQEGDKKAPKAEKSAPTPTKKPTNVPDAQNAGDNTVDLKSAPVPVERPAKTESAMAPPKVDKPMPETAKENNEVKDVVKEETAPKPVETASLPQPKPEIQQPTPKPPEPTPAPAEAVAEETPLPSSVPLPAARPKPEPPKEQAKPAEKPPEKPVEKKTETKTAEKTPEKKPAEKKQETAKTTKAGDSKFNPDDIENFLNKQDAPSSGAKASTQTAALGGKKTTGGESLSMSEMDALRGQIQNNWSTFAGIEGLQGMIITVTFSLDEGGNIVGSPKVSSTGGSDTARRTMEASARRAVLKSQPFQGLPADKYDTWSEVIVNFDPSDFAL